MKVDEDSGGMWCLVMFDLPVKTKKNAKWPLILGTCF